MHRRLVPPVRRGFEIEGLPTSPYFHTKLDETHNALAVRFAIARSAARSRTDRLQLSDAEIVESLSGLGTSAETNQAIAQACRPTTH